MMTWKLPLLSPKPSSLTPRKRTPAAGAEIGLVADRERRPVRADAADQRARKDVPQQARLRA